VSADDASHGESKTVGCWWHLARGVIIDTTVEPQWLRVLRIRQVPTKKCSTHQEESGHPRAGAFAATLTAGFHSLSHGLAALPVSW
jgi:hypothetical protein